jgi:hypothetical protein
MSAREMYREQTAYLAGVFDGEGCIGYWQRGTNYVLCAQIRMCHPAALKKFKEAFGGKIHDAHCPSRQKNNNRHSWLWQVHGKDAFELVRELRPFVIVKDLEFDVVLHNEPVILRPRRTRRSQAEKLQQADVCANLMKLKRVEYACL